MLSNNFVEIVVNNGFWCFLSTSFSVHFYFTEYFLGTVHTINYYYLCRYVFIIKQVVFFKLMPNVNDF